MPQPPPFVLPPDGLGSRVRALLAGAGRQRVAIALLALAALIGGGFVWARATPRLAGTTTGQEAVAPSDQTLPRAAPDTSSTTAPSDEVAVHVAGRVRRPGLVRLPAGSRVQDAIRAAGGVTSGADLNAINLARKLTDGEQIRAPAPGDPAPSPDPAVTPGSSGATPSAPLRPAQRPGHRHMSPVPPPPPGREGPRPSPSPSEFGSSLPRSDHPAPR